MIQKIISREEAVELTKKEIQGDDSDLFPIMENIQKAIKRKEFYCHFTGIMKEYTKEKLKRLGYHVEFFNGGGNQREPDYYKISWDWEAD